MAVTPSTSVAAAETVVTGVLLAQARRFVNTDPGFALTDASVGPSLAQSTTAIARVPIAGTRSPPLAVTKILRSPLPLMAFASVASVACQVSPPPFVIAFFTKSAAPGSSDDRVTLGFAPGSRGGR